MRGALDPRIAHAVAGPELARREATSASRKLARILIGDGLDARIARRVGGQSIRTELAAARIRAAVAAAGLRMCRHSHVNAYQQVPPGLELAESMRGIASSRRLGLPNGYKISAHTSRHMWRYSLAILDVPPDLRAVRGLVYLRPSVRVRQGRGTSLRVEMCVRGAWS